MLSLDMRRDIFQQVGTPTDVKPPTGLLYVELEKSDKKGRRGGKTAMRGFSDGREVSSEKELYLSAIPLPDSLPIVCSI